MKKTNLKKAVAAGLVVSMSAALAGCGGSGSGNGKTGKNTATDPAVAKENVYSYENLDVDFSAYDSYDILSTKVIDGKLYMAVETYKWSDEENTNQTLVYTMNTDGSDAQSFSLEMPDFSEYKPDNIEMNITDTTDGTVNILEDTEALNDASDLETDTAADLTTDTDTENVIASGDELIDILDPDDYYYDDYGYYENMYLSSINFLDNKQIVGYADYYIDGYVGDEYVSTEENFLCSWDADGKLLWKLSLKELTGFSYCYVNYFCSVSGNEFMTVLSGDETAAYVFDADGNVIIGKTASELAILDNIMFLDDAGDGRAFVMYYNPDDNYNSVLSYLDINTLTLKEEIPLPDYLSSYGFNSLSRGIDSDFIISTDTGIAKFNAGDSDITYFMNYINSDLEGYSVNDVTMIDSEHFIGSYYDLDTYDTVVAFFSYVDPSTIPDKQVITLAVYYIDSDVRSKVVEFNKASDQYRIVINSYSSYATDDDYLAGITKLNNEIIAGDCPDMIMMSSDMIDFKSYADKKMLADFDELIAGDDELKDNQYLTNVFDAFAINGKHYLGVYEFAYNSFIGSSKYFGDKTSWTISDFSELVKSLPSDSELLEGITNDGFLSYIMTFDGSEFIDVESGKCDFNSDDFIALLEYAASLPSSDDIVYDDSYYMDYYDQYRSGKTLMMNEYLYDLSWYNENLYECFNGEATMVGFPSRTGNSACISTDGMPILIFNNGNVDGAWSFARQFFTEDYQNSIEYDIPVLESAFDAWADKALERQYWLDDNGEKQYYDTTYYIDDVEYTVPVMSQDQVDSIKAQIKACTKSHYSNEEVLSIIEEEASALFSGQKTAKEVADIIQSRVQLYINENQ